MVRPNSRSNRTLHLRTGRRETLCIGLMVLFTSMANAKGAGTPWDIKQIGGSDWNGGRKSIGFSFVGGEGCPTYELLVVDIPKNVNAAKKAQAVCTRINKESHLKGTRDDDECKVEAMAPCTDIRSVVVYEHAYVLGHLYDHPGDRGTAVKDDAFPGDLPYVAIFDLVDHGGPLPEATATLQVGEVNPEISVPTYGRPASQVESDLIAAFNASPDYQELGYSAQSYGGAIRINQVPCPLGISGGTDGTTGYGWTVGMLDETEADEVGACCSATEGCVNTLIIDCVLQGAVPLGPGTMCDDVTCSAACCLPESGACVEMGIGDCYVSGGTFSGVGTVCLGDFNGNGRDDACEESSAIPTVSDWGLIVMTVLGLTVGTVVFGRRRRPAAA